MEFHKFLAVLVAVWVSAAALSLSAQTHPTNDSLALSYEDSSGNRLPYRLFVPRALEEGKLYPLVLFLHGSGQRGSDNREQVTNHVQNLIEATQTEEFSSYLLAPQAPDGDSWSSETVIGLTRAVLDEGERNHAVDPRRIYLTGLSMGGFGTFVQLFEYPTRYAEDGDVDISDPIAALDFLFLDVGTAPGCEKALDTNDDGDVDISDSVFTLQVLFGPSVMPFPAPPECGLDPTADGLSCDSYDAPCP